MTLCVVELVSSTDCPCVLSPSPPNRYQRTRQGTPAWLRLEMTMRDAACVPGTEPPVVNEPVLHMLPKRFLS